MFIVLENYLEIAIFRCDTHSQIACTVNLRHCCGLRKVGTHPNMALLYHADGKALALQFLDSLTDGFVVLGGYA